MTIYLVLVHNTGSLTELTMSGLTDNFLYMKGLREKVIKLVNELSLELVLEKDIFKKLLLIQYKP